MSNSTMPYVSKETIDSCAQDLVNDIKMGQTTQSMTKWDENFYSENPELYTYITTVATQLAMMAQMSPISFVEYVRYISALTYHVLKAQAESNDLESSC